MNGVRLQPGSCKQRAVFAQPEEESTDQSGQRILTRPPGRALMMPAKNVYSVRFVDLAREGSSLLAEARPYQ
jgi:hypothetical protein